MDLTRYQPVKVMETVVPARKFAGRHIEFSKTRFYFLLQGIFIGVVLIYQSFWYLGGETTMAACGVYWGPYAERRAIEPGTLMYAYKAGNKVFTNETTRNATPVSQEFIRVRYLTFMPSVSRLDTYEGNWFAFHIAWLIFFVITTMIFFIPNDTMPKNSYIYFSTKKPWIHMIVK